MTSWTPQHVLDTAAATEFVPEGAVEVRTGDYRLVRLPDWVLGAASGAAQVTWSRTGKPIGEVIGEVAALIRGWNPKTAYTELQQDLRLAATGAPHRVPTS